MNTELANQSRPDPREVQTRSDLALYLSQSLSGEYRQVVDETEVRSTSTYVKSYLMEANHDDDRTIASRLSGIFRGVETLQDKSLLRAVDQRGDIFFVDLRHPRFQVLHSIEVSSRTDQIFDRLTTTDTAAFDRVWMPAPFLQRVKRGQLTGFKFRFQTAVGGTVTVDHNRAASGTDEIQQNLRGRKFSMAVSEDAAAEREYLILMKNGAFRGRKALEQLQFRSVNQDEPDDYIDNGVYAYGKVVGKGTSIGGHLLTVDTVIRMYGEVISRIEDEYAVGWLASNGGYTFRGEPFMFWIPDDIEMVDLQAFTSTLFGATRPFRLFGIPHSQTSNRIDVEAIDLHSGDPVSFEITPDWIRVYLPRGSCGNIIARLYANLQRALSSDIRLTVGDSIDPFELDQR